MKNLSKILPVSAFLLGASTAGAEVWRSDVANQLAPKDPSGLLTRVGIGLNTAPTNSWLYIEGAGSATTGLTGASQYGIYSRPVFQSSATSTGRAGFYEFRTAAATFTMGTGVGLSIATPILGSGSTVTNLVGLDIANQTGGGTNYAIRTGTGRVSLGDNIWMTGTDGSILVNTSDGTDNKRLLLSGASSADPVRAAHLTLYGNEFASVPGDAHLIAGSGGAVRLKYGSLSTDGLILSNTGTVTIGGSLMLSKSSAGATNTATLENTNTAANSNASMLINTLGGAGSFAYTRFIAGSINWSTGALQDGTFEFTRQNGAGANRVFTVNSARNVSFDQRATVPGITSNANGSGATSAFVASGTTPTVTWVETGSGTDGKNWDIQANPGTFVFRTRTDANSTGQTWMTANRTGTTVSNVTVSAPFLIASTADVASNLTVGNTDVTDRFVNITAPAGQYRVLRFLSGTSPRWQWRVANGNETGSDANANFELVAHNDAGVPIDNPITITRAAGGPITMNRPLIMNSTLNPTGVQLTSTNSVVKTNSNANRILLTGGSTDDGLGGAGVYVVGNTYPGTGGQLYLGAGNVATGRIAMETGGQIRYQISQAGAHTVSGPVTMGNSLDVTGGSLTVGTNTVQRSLVVNGPAATDRQIRFQTAGVNRWIVQADNSTESGSTTGSDFVINSRDDAGNSYDNPVRIPRAPNSPITLSRPITVMGTMTTNSDISLADGKALVSTIGFPRTMIGRGGGNMLTIGDQDGWIDARYRINTGMHRFEVGTTPYLTVGNTGVTATGDLTVSDTRANQPILYVKTTDAPSALNDVGGMISLGLESRRAEIRSIALTNIAGGESWYTHPRMGLAFYTMDPGNGMREVYRINDQLNMMIGTITDDGSRLQVNGKTTTNDLRIKAFSTQYTIPFATNSSGDMGASTSLIYNSATETFRTANGTYSGSLTVEGTSYLKGDVNANQMKISVAASGAPYIANKNMTNFATDYALKQLNTGSTNLNAAAGTAVGITVGDALKMVVKASGSVGVGTTDPQATLDVNGDAKISNLLIANAAFSNAPYIASKAMTSPNYATDYALKQLNSGSTMLNAKAGTAVTVGVGDVAAMTVTPTLVTFSNPVTVTGELAVGTIKTTEWKVEPPDYVFEKDYELKSLKEVDSFVKKNKHLPDVPSAKEMKKNGMDLAEMNFTLLRKVEELTLHAIEQEKRAQKHEDEIASLKQTIARLAKKN